METLKKMGVKFSTIKIGDRLYICDESSKPSVEKKARRALNEGETVKWNDGSEQWMENDPVMDWTKHGSEMYQWKKGDGNKIACDKLLFTRVNGKVTKKVVRRVFMDYLKATNG
jgi:hypothetical protein